MGFLAVILASLGDPFRNLPLVALLGSALVNGLIWGAIVYAVVWVLARVFRR